MAGCEYATHRIPRKKGFTIPGEPLKEGTVEVDRVMATLPTVGSGLLLARASRYTRVDASFSRTLFQYGRAVNIVPSKRGMCVEERAAQRVLSDAAADGVSVLCGGWSGGAR